MRMTRNDIQEQYFQWMLSLVSDDTKDAHMYENLLRKLHAYEFSYILPMDKNRYNDGVSLRYRFLYTNELLEYKDILEQFPCSVLEMMVALALRIEEDIMSNFEIGDRTAIWFWDMIDSLGVLSGDKTVEAVLEKFLNRQYKKNGEGGLFTVKRSTIDMRTEEIWYQVCWYLSERQ